MVHDGVGCGAREKHVISASVLGPLVSQTGTVRGRTVKLKAFSLLQDANQALILILRVLKSGAQLTGPEIMPQQKNRVNHTIIPHIHTLPFKVDIMSGHSRLSSVQHFPWAQFFRLFSPMGSLKQNMCLPFIYSDKELCIVNASLIVQFCMVLHSFGISLCIYVTGKCLSSYFLSLF